MPTRRKPGRSRTARWAGLASQALTTQLAVMSVAQARSSPKTGPWAPRESARWATEPWAKYWRRIMSAEWARAARRRWTSSLRGARPWLVLTAFMVCRSEASGLVNVRA